MKLNGSLENFQPASLLQWFQTEQASGVLAVEAGPGYRLRFADGTLQTATFWPPVESLRRYLLRYGAGGEARLAELIDTAARRRAPFADLLAEELGPVEADRLLRSHTRRVVFHLLRETRGGFLFEPAAQPLPATLRTPFHLAELVLEQAHPGDEEELWVDCIPAPEMPVRSLLRTVKPASADEQLFLTTSEWSLLETLAEPRSLEDACSALGRPRRELIPVAELLATTGLLSLQPAPAPSRWPRSLLAGATLGAALVILALFVPSLFPRFGDASDHTPAPEPAGSAAETPAPKAAEPRPAPPPPRTEETATAPVPEKPRDADDRLVRALLEKQLTTELAAARRAITAGRPEQAQRALERAAILRPEDPRLTALLVQVREAVVAARATPRASPPAVPRPAPETPVAPPATEPTAVPGRLLINAIPYGFVRLDGEEMGATPLQLDLPPGRHTLEVFRAGYTSVVREIAVESATEHLENFPLELEDG